MFLEWRQVFDLSSKNDSNNKIFNAGQIHTQNANCIIA